MVIGKLVASVICRPFDTAEWKDFIAQPSVPYVLKMLAGLCHWHSKTQTALLAAVGKLHLLEQIASDQHIGTLAENLLEAMLENAQCKEEVGHRIIIRIHIPESLCIDTVLLANLFFIASCF